MRNIISFPFNIPRDGGEVECHGRAQNILGLPRRSIAKNVSNLLKQRTGSCKSASMTIFRTRFAAVNQFIRLIEETKAIGS
jgi:hypothetical protein